MERYAALRRAGATDDLWRRRLEAAAALGHQRAQTISGISEGRRKTWDGLARALALLTPREGCIFSAAVTRHVAGLFDLRGRPPETTCPLFGIDGLFEDVNKALALGIENAENRRVLLARIAETWGPSSGGRPYRTVVRGTQIGRLAAFEQMAIAEMSDHEFLRHLLWHAVTEDLKGAPAVRVATAFWHNMTRRRYLAFPTVVERARRSAIHRMGQWAARILMGEAPLPRAPGASSWELLPP